MTFREKVAEKYPCFVNKMYTGGVFSCPNLMFETNIECGVEYLGGTSNRMCKKCWNKEYDGSKLRPEYDRVYKELYGGNE